MESFPDFTRFNLGSLMNRVAGFVHSELMLDDGEARLRDRGAFVETAALSADVRVDVPVVESSRQFARLTPPFGCSQFPARRDYIFTRRGCSVLRGACPYSLRIVVEPSAGLAARLLIAQSPRFSNHRACRSRLRCGAQGFRVFQQFSEGLATSTTVSLVATVQALLCAVFCVTKLPHLR